MIWRNALCGAAPEESKGVKLSESLSSRRPAALKDVCVDDFF